MSDVNTNYQLDYFLSGTSYAISAGAGGFAGISNFFNDNSTISMEIEIASWISLSFSEYEYEYEYEYVMTVDEDGKKV